MQSHFEQIVEIRKAVIDGKLSATVTPAVALVSTKNLGTIQPGWKTPLKALETAAKRFGQSPDLPAAATALGDIGVACASCHKRGAGPKIEVGTPPADDKAVAGQMKRHGWATDRLWDGLYGPSDAAWKAGADTLAGQKFPEEVLKKGGVHARSSANNFSALVATAASKKRAEERAQLYASLLETCAGCHMAIRKK